MPLTLHVFTIEAIVGVVVSKPMPMKTTCLSGFPRAIGMHSDAEETMRTSAPAALIFCRLFPPVPGTLFP